MNTLLRASEVLILIYSLIVIGLLILSIVMIIYYFRMAKRLEEISINSLEASKCMTAIESALNKEASDIKASLSAQYKQYYFDHCFMSNLEQHEWYATGNQTPDHWEFACRKCGQIINVPKKLEGNKP